MALGLGGGLGGDRRGELAFNADVNVVPLIDVLLVLLIIFMLTAPLMQGGVEVELPRAVDKPREWELEAVDADGKKMKNVRVVYPRTLVPCQESVR